MRFYSVAVFRRLQSLWALCPLVLAALLLGSLTAIGSAQQAPSLDDSEGQSIRLRISEDQLGDLPKDGTWLRIRALRPSAPTSTFDSLAGRRFPCKQQQWQTPRIDQGVPHLLTLEHPGMPPRAAFLPALFGVMDSIDLLFADQLDGWITFELSLSGAVPALGTEVRARLVPVDAPGEPKGSSAKRRVYSCSGIVGDGAAYGMAPAGRYEVEAELAEDHVRSMAMISPLKNQFELKPGKRPVLNIPLKPAGALNVEANVPRGRGVPFRLDQFRIEVQRRKVRSPRSWELARAMVRATKGSTEGKLIRPSRLIAASRYLLGDSLLPGSYAVRATLGELTSDVTIVHVLAGEEVTCALSWPE